VFGRDMEAAKFNL